MSARGTSCASSPVHVVGVSSKRRRNSCWVLVMLLGLSAAVPRAPAAEGRFPDYFVPASVRVTIEPPEAATVSSWQVSSDEDASGWMVAEDGWLASGETAAGLPPGRHAIVFRTSGVWARPDPVPVVLAGGAAIVHAVTLSEATIYASLDDVPPQTVRHGDTLTFVVPGGLSLSAVDAHSEVVRDIQVDGGRFTYQPSPEEREQFSVTLSDGGIEKTVVITPQGILPSEQSVIEYRGDFPHPQSAERKTYLNITDERSASPKAFNYQTQIVRSVTISGPRVVFDRGHENGLFETVAYADDQIENDNVETLEIYADQVVVRGRLHLPGTAVTIYARELTFEETLAETGSLVTTPIELTSRSSGDGAVGLPAGDIAFYVAEIHTPGGVAERLVVKGGDGQDPKEGRDGTPLSNPARQVFTIWTSCSGCPAFPSSWSGRVIRVRQRQVCIAEVQDVISGADSAYYSKANVCARSGSDAVADGAPGRGGSGGALRAAFDLSALARVGAGSTGAGGRYRVGSSGDYPLSALKVRRDGGCFSWGSWYVEAECKNRNGRNAEAPGPTGPEPTAGGVFQDVTAFEWLHPVAIRSVLEYARDAYLNGYPEVVRELIEPYAAALQAYVDLPEDLELVQLRGEITTLLHRLDNKLDYFGFPAGWVPMLSFEITAQLFEDEVEAAGDLLYLTHYLNQAADQAVNKAAALTRLRAELSKETQELKSRLEDTRLDFEDLSSRADALSRDIRNLGEALKGREEELRDKAEFNAALKKAFRVAGNVLPLVPVAQPALGLAGAGLTAASKFNEQSAYDSAIEGTNLAHEFLQSHMEQSFQDFETATNDGGVDPLGAAFLARQQSLRGFDAGLVAVNQVLQETQTWESDVEKEIQILAAQDKAHKDLVRQIQELNARKRQFAEEMASLVQFAKWLMDGINQNSLALDNLNRDVVDTFNRIDQSAFRYVKELERRSKDRLLKYQYYLIKAYHYRLVRSYDEVDPRAFQLEEVYDHFTENFTNDIPEESGTPILDRDLARDLVAIYREQLRQVTSKIVEGLIGDDRPEQTDTIFVELTQEQLDRLNSWDASFGPNPEADLRINFVDGGGLFDQQQENLRIFELTVETLEASPRAGSDPARVTLHMEHSGESLVASRGDTYKFNHYRTLETPPIAWRSRYDPAQGTHTNPGLSVASNSLLLSLLEEDPNAATDDLLLYSRPAAWADLVLTKETLSDFDEMVIDRLVLRLRFDFSQKQRRQADLEVQVVATDGQVLYPDIVVRNTDENFRADGRGGFLRVYRSGESVEMEAPPAHGAYSFGRWEDRRGEPLGNGPVVAVNLPSSDPATVSKMRAVYVPGGPIPPYRRGDANNDGAADLTDAVNILEYLYKGAAAPPCEKTGDVNDDGEVDLTDPIRLLAYLYQGGEIPPEPFESCGPDIISDLLTCNEPPPCP